MTLFWTKNLIRDVITTIGTSILVTIFCFIGPTIHTPFLIGMLTALGLGWLQPQKGWLLAIEQTVLIAMFYFAFNTFKIMTPLDAEATQFTALLQFFPAFTGSFLGSFIRKIFK